jgi:hypothetical protein
LVHTDGGSTLIGAVQYLHSGSQLATGAFRRKSLGEVDLRLSTLRETHPVMDLEALEPNREGSFKLGELVPGMVLTDDILTRDGRIVVARGRAITIDLLVRLRRFCAKAKIVEPVKAFVPPGKVTAA